MKDEMKKQLYVKKRKILVIEDNALNREILSEILREEFEILEAENGEEGIRLLKQHRQELSLVLLDVYMPVCDGFVFLQITQQDPYLSSVPVIVTTGSENYGDEEKCLQLGATDYVTKPYQPEALLGRIRNIVRYRESLSTLAVVEYDNLTGVYTMSAFYHHIQQILQENKKDYDLILMQIRDFPALNSIYGEKKGREILKYTAEELQKAFPGGILARQENSFYLLEPSGHIMDMQTIQEQTRSTRQRGPIANIRIHICIYQNIDKTQPISALCDKLGMGSIPEDYDGSIKITYYDEKLQKKQIEEQRLLMSFETAIERGEFIIYLQPKIEITSGEIVAAEALVRWREDGEKVISPGVFIPLLERENMICELDEYVFRTVCTFQNAQRRQGNKVIPISVNLSRNSLYQENIISRYQQIARENQVELSLIPIEITESSVVSDKRTIEVCDAFVKAGFTLHMDDFGSGYSSFSSLAALPFSILKIDKSLIDRIETQKGSIIVKSIINTARDLGMQVVAEGVEEKTQAVLLAQMECNLIQGYYYSRPVETREFEHMMQYAQAYKDKKIHNDAEEGVNRITRDELKLYLRACVQLFSSVRILDPANHAYQIPDENGIPGEIRTPCFDTWNRSGRCENCIAMKAIKSKQTEHKFEVFGNDIYFVYAAYVEVEGVPKVIELVNTVGEDMIHGYRKNPTFLQAIQTEDQRLYEDAMFGIYNRRFYEEQIGKLDGVTAVAMFDIDHFKSINDSYGHVTGDNVLKAVIATVKKCIRKTDYLIRLGGDEFLIVFSGLEEQYLKKKLESIRAAVENTVTSEEGGAHVTISIGGCGCKGLFQQVIDCADKAMYEGKKTRNTVVINHYSEK